MEVLMSPGTTTLSWGSCPEELLRMILKKSSMKCLVSCMTVNRRWKAIVLDYIELYSLWPRIVSETMVNKGRTFRRKSVLSCKDILINSMLWSFVPLAMIELHHTYALQVSGIQVNKEKLILSANPVIDIRSIRYYNITNTELIRSQCSTESNIKENEYITAVLAGTGRRLYVYGKESLDHCGDDGDDGDDDDLMFKILNPQLYRLEDNVCYVLSKRNVVWAFTWNGEYWGRKSRGRYYGNALDTVCGINVYNERVCLVTKLGFILCEDPKSQSYHKLNSFNLVASIQDSTVLELFSQNGVAISVNNSNQRIKFCQDLKSDIMWLECAGMTCATEHGEVLFIGYKDGTVAICTPHTMPATRGQPDRLLNVKDFDRSIRNPSILAVEVFEDKMSHHLLVATKRIVLQLRITYPDYIRQYYE